MLDLKTLNLVIEQLAEERGIPREKMLEAVESALATAYNREYGKRGQIVRAHFNAESGDVDFYKVKIVVDPAEVRMEEEGEEPAARPVEGEDERVRYNEEKHIFLDDARRVKRDTKVGDEIVFPLEKKTDFGRIAAQTAKQIIMQKIREAERASVVEEYGGKEGDIVNGIVQRSERGNLYVDLGRATGIMPFHEQIPGERYRPGERIHAYLFSVEEGVRGVYLRLSRSHPKFLEKLFEMEVPEIKNGAVAVKAIAREAGGRSKIAVAATDERIDPVGALVGQRGVRVSTVMSELGGERIDIIEYAAAPATFIEDALSPARVLSVTLNEAEHRATVEVSEDQQSLAIGRGGQNVRLAAKLTGWSIDIRPVGGAPAVADAETPVVPHEEGPVATEGAEEALLEKEEGAVQPPEEAVVKAAETELGKEENEAIEEAPDEMDTADKAEDGKEEK
ncbi:MAG: transcription termination factor NusA [Patescibacteria group bacterium]